jgi:hypothetical protein
MRPTKRSSSIASGNRADYRKAFLGHVHKLLRAGYAALTPSQFTDAEEDDITGELCKHMKHLTEVAPASPWMQRYSIHDQDPVNDATREKDGTIRRGKRRPRLDIRIVHQTRAPKPSFSIEAKRLYRGDSVAAYMDEEGLNAFVQEYYARDDAACGMLGYVQSGTLSEWSLKLNARLCTEPSVIPPAPPDAWIKTATETAGVATYLSRHNRRAAGDPIDIHHTLLLFV